MQRRITVDLDLDLDLARQSQHPLADDVALDLVRAIVTGELKTGDGAGSLRLTAPSRIAEVMRARRGNALPKVLRL